MSPFVVLYIAFFSGLIIWSVRHSKAHTEEKHRRLASGGFLKEEREHVHKRLADKWGSLEKDIFRKSGAGYILWHLEKPDSDGPATPLLVIEFDQPAAYPLNVWVMPAFAREGGMGHKAFGFLAKFSGYKHRLSVPFGASGTWWAFGAAHGWGVPLSQDFWRALSYAPPLSIEFKKEGVRIETQSDPKTFRTLGPLSLLERQTIDTIDKLASAIIRGR